MPTVSIHWLFPFLLWGSVVTEDGCRWIETYANHPAGSDAEEDALAAQVAAQQRSYWGGGRPYRCGDEVLLRLAKRDTTAGGRSAAAALVQAAWEASAAEGATAISGEALSAAFNALARFAGPVEKGAYLRQAMELRLEVAGEASATKNYAYWAEQRGLVRAARAALADAIRSVGSGSVGAAKTSRASAGLRLFNASLCPPHFRSEDEARRRYHGLLEGLDALLGDLSRERSVWLPSPVRQQRQQNQDHHHHHHHHHHQEDGQRDSFLESPLRAVGALPIAWPYLGLPVRPLIERLAKGYRLLANPSLTMAAPQLADEETLRRQQQQQQQQQQRGEARPIRLAVISEAQGNTSPGQLIEGVLEGLKRLKVASSSASVVDEFELVWVELEGLSTAFSERMRRLADVTVVIGGSVTGGGGGGVGSGRTSSSATSDMEAAEDPVAAARRAIAGAAPDVALYLALGLTPLTYLLAQARLAPVQVSFGHGHPITSGSASVDYFVSSLLFEPLLQQPDRKPERQGGGGGAAAAGVAATATAAAPIAEFRGAATPAVAAAMVPGPRNFAAATAEPRTRWDFAADRSPDPLKPSLAASSAGAYSEQLVLFDTLTTGFRPPFGRPDGEDDRPQGRYSRTALFRRLGLYDTVANAAAAVATGGGGGGGSGGGTVEGANLYACLQHSKKLHPRFDAALRGLLEADPLAVVLLLEGARTHAARWLGAAAAAEVGAPPPPEDEDEVSEGAAGGEGAVAAAAAAAERWGSFGPGGAALWRRLAFVPRMPHAALLSVVGVSDAFLDTFPWGAGVTSFEAFAACVPVVTLPDEVTVLQLALGQYRQMGLATELVARNVPEYVHLASRLGADPLFRDAMRRRICSRKHLLFNQQPAVDEWAAFLRRAVGLPYTRR
jgi:hypothetical protein